MRCTAPALALTLGLLAQQAMAQTDDSTGGRWEANGELSFTDLSGNRSLSLLGTSLTAKREHDARYELAFGTGARYGRNDGEVAVSVYNADANLRLHPDRPVSPFVRGTALRDGIRNLNLRLALVAGAEFNALRAGPNTLTLGVAVLQDYESRALMAGSTEPASVSKTRFNFEVRAASQLREGVTLEHQSQLQPVADDPADFLFTAETAMKVELSRRLGFHTRYLFNHDATPLPGVEFHNDRTLTVGLNVRLR